MRGLPEPGDRFARYIIQRRLGFRVVERCLELCKELA
jgi:hypothetical protein